MTGQTPSILVVTPVMRDVNGRSRLYTRALASIFNLSFPRQLDHYITNGGDDYSDNNGTVTRKYQDAQRVFLAGTWSHMLCVEYDMIVPPDTIQRLLNTDADIAYGLYVLRHGKKQWCAYTELTPRAGKSLSELPLAARRQWGTVIEVAGIGQGCTLIRRHVLETLPFRHTPGVCSDWCLALDAADVGFSQRCDLGLICGHQTIVPSPQTYWPDINEPELYRIEYPA